ncbi:MAG: hemolysin family protein [Bacteroidota bacterium]
MIPIILVSIVFSAFFSGMEIAFLSANKLKIELDNKQGKLAARIISKFTKAPSKYIATMLVGNNIALVIYGLMMAELLGPPIKAILPISMAGEIWILIIQTTISTLLILLAAEYLPKAIFRLSPNGILNILAVPVLLIYYILYPIVFIIILISDFILIKLFKVNYTESKPAFGKVDLDHYIRDISSNPNKESEINSEIQMFQNALDFTKVKVRECMIPRPDVIALDIDEPIEVLKNKFIETGLSKILIFRNSIDDITGYIHSFEMFKHPKDIQSILLPITFVPETMPANQLLTIFTKQHKSIAVVVDEYGGTSGMITIEDVMEEIFGEIEDEHDTDETVEKKITENEFLFSGRLEVDYLNSKYNFKIPAEEEYETLAGFIVHMHESIPEINEIIIVPPFVFKIIKVENNRVEEVLLKIDEEAE